VLYQILVQISIVTIGCIADLCGVCVDRRLADSATSSRRPQVCEPCCCDIILWRGQVSPAWIL